MQRIHWANVKNEKNGKTYHIEFDDDGNLFIDDKKVKFHEVIELRWIELVILIFTALCVFAQALHDWWPCFNI